ncbi:hypothetical protein [Wolbachia endosymbiont of Cantharis cryptica]|uniref:hypothetical protein n=1 Tax=Wolbachia endosymbiont of Cantharis cryptica TaxID=3066132 RepID=UPI00376EAD96
MLGSSEIKPSVEDELGGVIGAMSNLCELHQYVERLKKDRNILIYLKGIDIPIYLEDINILTHLKDTLNKIGIIKDPAVQGLAMVKFLRSIAEGNKLRTELEILEGLIEDSNGFYSQLGTIITDFKLPDLLRKMEFLTYLKEERKFADILKCFEKHEWRLCDLINDKAFQAYIKKALNERKEPFRKGFEEDIDKYIKKAEEDASKYFKGYVFQAYYAKNDNAGRVLNINLLINQNGNEPIRISDILQQEKDISELNIYCNEKHEIYAYRDKDKRNYEFKEDACYEMTITWLAEYEPGKTLMCTMIMNVSSDGITKIVEFNGKKFESPSKEFWELIGKNDEIRIQGDSLHDAVKKSLHGAVEKPLVYGEELRPTSEEQTPPDAVPDNNASHTETNLQTEVHGQEQDRTQCEETVITSRKRKLEDRSEEDKHNHKRLRLSNKCATSIENVRIDDSLRQSNRGPGN